MRQQHVINMTDQYPFKFYNTAIPKNLEKFDAPVVLMVNPHMMTDKDFHKLDPIPSNLMMVRFRANMWNRALGEKIVKYYTQHHIPVIFTFMAYYTEVIPNNYKSCYTYRKRTLNSYWVITQEGWDRIIEPYQNNEYVYTCGKNANSFPCHRCGNCLREYFATMERLKGENE